MKIIQSGKANPAPKRTECWFCDCIFEHDRNDWERSLISGDYYVKCPECQQSTSVHLTADEKRCVT